MKRYIKSLCALVLCLAMCLNGSMPVSAANELRAVFSVTLDKQEITKS